MLRRARGRSSARTARADWPCAAAAARGGRSSSWPCRSRRTGWPSCERWRSARSPRRVERSPRAPCRWRAARSCRWSLRRPFPLRRLVSFRDAGHFRALHVRIRAGCVRHREHRFVRRLGDTDRLLSRIDELVADRVTGIEPGAHGARRARPAFRETSRPACRSDRAADRESRGSSRRAWSRPC